MARQSISKAARLSRRASLRLGGLAGVGLAGGYLAACGGGGGTPRSPAASAPAPSGGSAPAAGAAASPTPGGTLKVHILAEASSLAPFDTSNSSHSHLLRLIHGNGLVKSDYDLKIVPDLAESWKISDDGTQYTFVLRDGLKFSNGRPLDAKAVVANFDKIRDPNTGSWLRAYYGSVKSIEAVDARTVRFTLPEPFAPFLAFLTDRSFITDVENYSTTNPVGPGPFTLVEWVRGSHMRLKRNPNYWDKGKPYVDELFIQFQPDETQGFNLVRTKEVHLGNIPANLLGQNRNSKDFSIIERPSISITNRIFFNHAQPPFNDPRMRDAVNLAIDREQIVQVGIFGAGAPATGAFPKESPWYTAIEAPKQDYQKAREMVRAAGFEGWTYEMPQGTNGPSLRIGEYLQQEWGKIGLNIKLKPIETAEYIASTLVTKKFLITHIGATGRIDPDQDLYAKCHSKGTQNWTDYSNPRMDELLDKGRRTIQFEERKKIYDDIHRLLFQDKPWIYTGLQTITRVALPNTKGYQLHPESQLEYFDSVYLQK